MYFFSFFQIINCRENNQGIYTRLQGKSYIKLCPSYRHNYFKVLISTPTITQFIWYLSFLTLSKEIILSTARFCISGEIFSYGDHSSTDRKTLENEYLSALPQTMSSTSTTDSPWYVLLKTSSLFHRANRLLMKY